MTDNARKTQERVYKSGSLSKKASFRIIVEGEIGSKEIENLIRQIELEKEALS